jgi:hypothetical protein
MLRKETTGAVRPRRIKAVGLLLVSLLVFLPIVTFATLPFRIEGLNMAGHKMMTRLRLQTPSSDSWIPQGFSKATGSDYLTWEEEHLESSGAPTYCNLRVGDCVFAMCLFPVKRMVD